MLAVPSVREIDAALTGAGAPFEIEVVEIEGRPTKTWKHAPASLGEILARSREVGGERPLIVLGDERLSHAEHADRAGRLAAALIERYGVLPGDRVAIAMRNIPEWSIAFFGAALAGAVAVPLNAFWNGGELAFALDDCGAKVLLADGERLERLADQPDVLATVALVGTRLDDRKTSAPLPRGIDTFDDVVAAATGTAEVAMHPDDPATIFYTSGTTARPKGVFGTHRNICSNVVSMRFVGARAAMRAGVDPASIPPTPQVVLVPVPLFHATGCHSNLVAQAYAGGTVVFMRRWDPDAALDVIERERVTGMSGVPTMAWDLVNASSIAGRDLSSLRSLGGGGAAAPPELLRRIQAVLPGRASGTGYGMTESSSLTTSIGGVDYVERPRSVGVPVPVCDVRIAGDDGNEVPVGDVGEIWIKGPTVVPGYWRRPDATAATFTDGWLHSGDLGRVDDDGFVYIVDRAKDMVIRGGENISSIEVEAALYDHPDVLEAAVFPVPHAALGEEVGAVVRLRPGAATSADDLRAHAAEVLASFKVPAHVWLRDEPFPRGDTGKMLKRALRTAYAPPAAARG